MIERGILEQRPGFSSVQLTAAGREAMADWQDRNEAMRAAEMGY